MKGLPRLTYGAHKSEHRGLAYDIDGTITGWPGSTIVPDRPFFTSSACEARPLWGNMSICPHTYASFNDGRGYDGGNLRFGLVLSRLLLKVNFSCFNDKNKYKIRVFVHFSVCTKNLMNIKERKMKTFASKCTFLVQIWLKTHNQL